MCAERAYRLSEMHAAALSPPFHAVNTIPLQSSLNDAVLRDSLSTLCACVARVCVHSSRLCRAATCAAASASSPLVSLSLSESYSSCSGAAHDMDEHG